MYCYSHGRGLIVGVHWNTFKLLLDIFRAIMINLILSIIYFLVEDVFFSNIVKWVTFNNSSCGYYRRFRFSLCDPRNEKRKTRS